MLTTNQKGAIAETAIAHQAIKLGIEVYRPIAEGSRCDLILLVSHTLVRVQCKWATRHGEVVAVRCYSSRRGREGVVRRYYTAEEIDAFIAYCADVDRCFFFPRTGSRLTPRFSCGSGRPGTTRRPEFTGPTTTTCCV